jgi:hypothetical protein
MCKFVKEKIQHYTFCYAFSFANEAFDIDFPSKIRGNMKRQDMKSKLTR